MINKLRKFTAGYVRLTKKIDKLDELLVRQELEALKAHPRYANPRSLVPYGAKVYSQADEDGLIREIFRRVGTTNKRFVEFGVGTGLENNTLALLYDGWTGLWIEGAADSFGKISAGLTKTISSGKLKVKHAFITRENINSLIDEGIEEDEIDLLSVDIDGNDFHVFDAIRCVSPRVVVMEYNAKFIPPTSYCMKYDADHVWRDDDCMGASLKFLEVALEAKGYRLVGCSLSGANAFFVRDDLVEDHFLSPFTAEFHYEPARYYLCCYASGHPAAFRTLDNNQALIDPSP